MIHIEKHLVRMVGTTSWTPNDDIFGIIVIRRTVAISIVVVVVVVKRTSFFR